MNVLDRIDRFQRIWQMLVPQFWCPDDAQVYRWAGRFDDDALAHGVQRVRAKIAKGGITSQEAAARYLTGVLLNEERKRREMTESSGVESAARGSGE